MPKARADAFLRAAYEYYNAGFLPVPLQGGENAKLPLWRCVAVENGFDTNELTKLYQRGWGEFPFDWERFEELFRLAGGIGIACGSCSRGLAVIDFDDPAAHKIWIREHAEVAARMPAVKTARGIHYYFVPAKRLQGAWKVFRVAGYAGKAGELKLERTYVAAPPSKHPSGVRYKWQGPSILERRPPVIELADLGLTLVGSVAGLVEADQESDQADQREQLGNTLNGSLTHSGGALGRQLGTHCWAAANCMLRRHLPRQANTRNKCLMDLVRSLKSIDELRDYPASHFRRLIETWCEELDKLAHVRDSSFKTNWASFSSAWQSCKYSSAEGFSWHIRQLKLVGLSSQDKVRAICDHLGRQNEGNPFFLGSITLANAIDKSQKTAMRLLQQLVRERELLKVGTGSRKDGTANMYLIGPKFQFPRCA